VASSREQVARLLGVQAEQVVFTSGATEANEAVLRHHIKLCATLITSTAEHPAVAGYYFQHTPQLVRTVPLDKSGRWRLDALETVLSSISGPKLIAFAWANGETGVLQDLAAIKAMAERYNAACLVDASQAVGRVAFEADSAVYLTFSGHKLHAPKGVGVLVQPETVPPVEISVGGGQERGWRGGTLNVPGIVGLGVACELRKRDLNRAITDMARLRDHFESQVLSAIPNARVNGADAQRVPNTSNLTVPGVDGMALVARLEARGILCSQVSACSSGQPEPSRTLLAMGLSRDDAYASLRIAVAVDTREDDIEFAAQAFVEEALFLRAMMGDLV
jgi:cysteine desulfurase